MTFNQKKPNLVEMCEQGISCLNLDGLDTKTSKELESQNDDFIFEPNSDDGILFGYYIALSYYTANEGSWRKNASANGCSNCFSIDLKGEDYGSFQGYFENLKSQINE